MFSWLFLGLFSVGTMGEVEGPREMGESLCRSYGYTVIEGKFGTEKHLLCLKMKPIGMTHMASSRGFLLLDPDPEVISGRQQPNVTLGEVTLAYGFPAHAPGSGSAEGYVGEDHQFYGILHLGNRTLYADPYGRDDPAKAFGAYDDDVAGPLRPRREYAQFRDGFNKPTFPYNVERRRRPAGAARARICDLLLLADKEFFERDANASLTHAVRRMMHAVAQADVIFRNADFNEDGVPDNIGFSVKYVLVLTSEETSRRVFGELPAPAVDGRGYLMRFARLRRLGEVCLGVAFSGHAFHNRTLGLSFTSLGGGPGGAAGGLCDRRAYGRSFNTLAIAHATADGARVPERIAALTLAHEIGHSFGAHHDDSFPDPECRGYLMGSQSTAANRPTHFEFSPCSKQLIADTLSSMSYCLAEEEQAYCGNGIVEEGEACDCGMPARCAARDSCCSPRAGGALLFEEGTHKAGCQVAPSATCHPSQGPCCNQECQYADLLMEGIECRNSSAGCACARPECRCGLGGRCLPDRSCHAAECVALGLRECHCDQWTVYDGRLAEAQRCGACCVVPGEAAGGCMVAEAAARRLGNHTVPLMWIDADYTGPNLTIKLCKDCAEIAIRAWPINNYCVTRNMVGVCAGRGVCELGQRSPRPNVYPRMMFSKQMNQESSRSPARARMLSRYATFILIYMLKL